MQEEVDLIFNRIANHIVSVIDTEWSVIIINGEAADGSLELDCRYRCAESPEEVAFFAPEEVLLDFLRLRYLIHAQIGKNWETFDISIYSEGDFEINFTYANDI